MKNLGLPSSTNVLRCELRYSDAEIFGQVFKADGSKEGTEFQVNTYTREGQGAASARVRLKV